jgi:hypothetical protein
MMLRRLLETAAEILWRCRRAEFADHPRKTRRSCAGEFPATGHGLAQKIAPRKFIRGRGRDRRAAGLGGGSVGRGAY